MVPREIEDNGYAIFFVEWEWGGRGGGGGGLDKRTNKVYNGLYENGQLIVFNSRFVLPFAMPREWR